MSKLTVKDIHHIANLAKLTVTGTEAEHLMSDLNNIFDFVAKMNRSDTGAASPISHPYQTEQPLRDDIVTEKNERPLLQASAPQVEAGLYIVPAVLDQT